MAAVSLVMMVAPRGQAQDVGSPMQQDDAPTRAVVTSQGSEAAMEDLTTRPPQAAETPASEAAAPAQDVEAAAEDEPSWLDDHLRHNLQPMLYYTEFGVRDDSLLNPGNALARLPQRSANAELRLDLKLVGYDWLAISLKPRLWAEAIEYEGSAIEEERVYKVRAFMRQWSLGFYGESGLSLTVGRQIPVWGPANFRSPSNPFYFDNGRANPLRELDGIDVVEASYTPAPGVSFTLMHKLGEGGRQPFQLAPRAAQQTLFKVDYSGEVFAMSMNASKYWDQKPPNFGGFLQLTLTDALLYYVEADIRTRSEALYPRETSNPVGGDFTKYASSEFHPAVTSIVGASYTFRSGHTLCLEYLFSSEGYRADQTDLRFDLTTRAQQLLAMGQEPELATAVMTDALDNHLRLQNPYYLFLQLQNAAGEDLMWQLRNAVNTVDRGGQAIAYLEWNMLDHLSIYGVGMASYGTRQTEFRGLVTYALTMGLKGYL